MLHLRKKKGKLEPHSEYEYGGKRNSVSQESNNRRPTRGEPLNQRVFSDRNTFTSITQSHKQRWQHYLYSAPHQETRLLHRQFIHRTLYQESQTILYTSFRLTSIFLIRQKYVANFVSDLKKNHLKYHNTKLIQSGVTTTIIDILCRHRTFVIMVDVNLCTQNSIG